MVYKAKLLFGLLCMLYKICYVDIVKVRGSSPPNPTVQAVQIWMAFFFLFYQILPLNVYAK